MLFKLHSEDSCFPVQPCYVERSQMRIFPFLPTQTCYSAWLLLVLAIMEEWAELSRPPSQSYLNSMYQERAGGNTAAKNIRTPLFKKPPCETKELEKSQPRTQWHLQYPFIGR